MACRVKCVSFLTPEMALKKGDECRSEDGGRSGDESKLEDGGRSGA